MHFDDFFRAARDTSDAPFDYQCRLACGERKSNQTREDWLTHGVECNSKLIAIPTGLGKTAAVVLAWLWNRLAPQISNRKSGIGNPVWPRRLVYCLPMRTLVEQTAREVTRWFRNLHAEAESLALDADAKEQLAWLAKNSPSILMGGEDPDPLKAEWDLYPERPAILIGTQDMLLSRALNRGYGMSRYRWPMHFGLLSNDSLWVLDETQLMGVGLDTSAQLAGFRDRFGTLAPCVHWWMSATLDEERLGTPEAPPTPAGFQLSDEERQVSAVQHRLKATKRLRRADTAISDDAAACARDLVSEILGAHSPGTLTLVILNRVERAQEIYREMRRQAPGTPATLLHSRFRPHERQALVRRVLGATGDHIVVSTQVVEAGVDLSARTLFTELAPWPSLVQRFGRCHRHGEMAATGADIRWVDVPDEDAAPYAAEELFAARPLLVHLTDASPAALATVTPPPAPDTPRHIVRPKDLRELFDTTPDIAGADLDISRFIREGEDSDCLVFWRNDAPQPAANGPAREELCMVPVGRLRELAAKLRDKAVWVWDTLDRQWVRPERFVPGRTYWLLSSVGGYDAVLGFNRRSKAAVVLVPRSAPVPPEAHGDEPGVTVSSIEDLEQHTTAVMEHALRLGHALGLPRQHSDALALAARWHDVGKAHPVFQAALRHANAALDGGILYAKSGTQSQLVFMGRPHFRHELASALVFRSLAAPTATNGALVAYLIAAHHGKVRLSLRSLPGEAEPPPPLDGTDPLYARGIWHGDKLPAFTLLGESWPEVTLSLAPMQIGVGPDGEPSWLESCLELRDAPELGPFRLGLLEALLRAADMRASQASSGSLHPSCAAGASAKVGLHEKSTTHGGAVSLTSAEQLLVSDLVADGLSSQAEFGPEPLYRNIGQAEEQRTFEQVPEELSALEGRSETRHGSHHELAGHHRSLAETPVAGKDPPPLDQHSGTGGAEHGLRGGTGQPGNPPRDTRPERATRFIETTHGVLSYSQLAPLLAERVVAVQADIERGLFGQRPFDESLLLEFHLRIAADLVPDWAGRWRTLEVRRSSRSGSSAWPLPNLPLSDTMPEPLYLHGCRHDVLGHYLKAIGLLRVLAKCADEGHRDAGAEGWWDTNA